MIKRNPMIHQYVRTDRYCDVKNSSTKRFGGYKMYFKLFQQLVVRVNLSKLIFTRLQHCKMTVIIYLKFPWWCIVKPLGQFFTVLTVIEGKYKVTVINGNTTFGNDTIVKSKTYKVFGVPYFYHKTQLTQADIQELIK